MDQFGWSESEAILYMGILLASGGFITVFCFWAVGPASRRFGERKLMILAGIIPMIIGRAIMFPFPFVDPPQTPWGDNLTQPLLPYVGEGGNGGDVRAVAPQLPAIDLGMRFINPLTRRGRHYVLFRYA